MISGNHTYVTGENLRGKTDCWLEQVARAVRPRPHLRLKPRECALLVIDVIRYFTAPDGASWLPASAAILPMISRLLECWRSRGGTVIFTRHCHDPEDSGGMLGVFYGSVIRCADPDSRFVLKPLTGETVIRKNTYDSFHETGLEEVLRENSITQVLITGVLTHLCCETAARSAFVRGFEVYMAADATASSSESLHTGSLLSVADGFGVLMDTPAILNICSAS